MSGVSSTASTASGLWPLIAEPDTAPAPADVAAFTRAARRFARLIGAAMADSLLRPACGRRGLAPLDAVDVAKNRLAARFAAAQARRWLGVIDAAGIETVCLKGYANAWTLYDDPEARIQGDVDLLVRGDDLDALVRLLAGHGFRFRPLPAPAWGAISDASFMPLVGADGGCNIDLHVHPDCYPAWRSLATGDVFAAARMVDADGLAIRVPSPEHALTLCITNAAKDKFDIYSLRKVVDAMALLRRHPALDWDAVAALARDGRFLRPARAFGALLVALGTAPARIPAGLSRPPRWPARATFGRVVADFEALFPHTLPLTELFWRELVLAAEPDVALHNFRVRLRGLVRPGTALPPGVSPATGLPGQG